MRLSRKRLLIVDDEPDTLESLRLLLSPAYDVCVARNGAEALDEVNRGFHPDAVLLDLIMPTMDGLEMARELARTGLRAPILVISGDPEAERKAREAGIHEVLTKPFTYEQLKAKLERVLKTPGAPKSGGGFLRGLILALPARVGGA
ncbi:MAG: response regulator [Bacteroidota bacterium]